MKITIGDYLLKRLKEIGIEHIIGVPGDFNLQFLEQIRDDREIKFVGSSNELNAAYAADGYSREKGISALSVTFGVGDLGALPGVAASYAEHIPVIVISGAPPLYASRHNYKVHHSLADGDYGNITRCWREYTAVSVLITQENAAEEIDRAIRQALITRKPVNIQLPSNLTYLEIDAEMESLKPFSHVSDSERLESCTEAALKILKNAEKPFVLIDMDVDRLGIKEDVLEFIEKTGIPFASMTTGKSILDETHPLFRGMYKGDESDKGVQEAVEGADFLLTVSPRFIEWNSGTYTNDLPEKYMVLIARDHTFAGDEVFEGVSARDVIKELIEKAPSDIVDTDKFMDPQNDKEEETFVLDEDRKLTQENLWKIMDGFIEEGDRVYAETGTALQGLGSIRMPADVKFTASHIWGAIGYMLPMTFGGGLAAPSKRHLLFIGDGSFQVTAQELSRIEYNKLKPIIFIIENDGYTIERYIMGMNADYNDIPAWKYSQLPRVFNEESLMMTSDVYTEGELKNILMDVRNAENGAFIVLHLEREDAPEALKKFGPAVAEFNYGDRGPQNEEPQES